MLRAIASELISLAERMTTTIKLNPDIRRNSLLENRKFNLHQFGHY
jgi:hypothetical protein